MISEELEMGVDEFIDTLLTEKVSYIIDIGASPATSRLVIEQAKKHENMYCAVGIHPSDTRFLTDMETDLAEIREMILDKIWPGDAVVMDRTVDVNITRIRKKIGDYGKYIKTRFGYGYTFDS